MIESHLKVVFSGALEFRSDLTNFTSSPQYIIWHHSGTNDDASAKAIHGWHTQRVSPSGEKWSGIGYHYVVRRNGSIEKGRPDECVGAHTRGLNRQSLAICFSGNLDKMPLSAAQMASGMMLSRQLMRRYGICADNVIGHREINELANRGVVVSSARTAKSCPGKHIDMGLVRALLRERPLFKTGCDVLRESGWYGLQNKRVGLVTNHTGTDANGCLTSHLMMTSGKMELCAIFTLEHGLNANVQGAVADSNFEGVPVYSLHKTNQKSPASEQLMGLDALVWDVQDAGCRFFTHCSSMLNILKSAAMNQVPVFVLDRPNPLNGVVLEGPLLPKNRIGFSVGPHTIPVRYGLTIGELARMINTELGIGAKLEVIPMEGWDPESGIPMDCTWRAISPNLTTIPSLLMYPGIGLLEPFLKYSAFDISRGTNRAFQKIGAPWIDGNQILHHMQNQHFCGVELSDSKYCHHKNGIEYGGVSLELESCSPGELRPISLGLEIATAIWRNYPTYFPLQSLNLLLANYSFIEAIKHGRAASEQIANWGSDHDSFRSRRRPYLLYSR